MAKVLIVDGKVCADAGTVRLDCDCAPSSGCCTPDQNGDIFTLHLPPDSTTEAFLTGSVLGGFSANGPSGDTDISVVASFNRLALIVPAFAVPECDNAFVGDRTVASSDNDPGITVSGSYDGTTTGSGSVASWQARAEATRIAGKWNGSSPPDSITTELRVSITLDVEYQIQGGGSEFRTWSTELVVAENPCDPLEVDPCKQSFEVNPLGMTISPCSTGGLQLVASTPGPGTIPGLNGFDAGRWDISADFLRTASRSGTTLSLSGDIDLRVEMEWRIPTEPTVVRTKWLACQNWADAVELCQATGTTCCDQGDCGKESASFPFRWRRIVEAATNLYDRTTAGVPVQSWRAVAPRIDDTQNSTGGECALSQTLAVIAAGSTAKADQFGVNRILSMAGATIGGTAYGTRVRVAPDPAPGLGKRFDFDLTAPINWTQSGQSAHPIGVLLVQGFTVDGAGTSTLLNIVNAEFRWNTVLPATAALGVQFDPGESRPAVEAVANGTEFDLVGTPTSGGCYRQLQLIPRVDPGAPTGPFVVRTDRTLRMINGVNVTPYRNVVVEVDVSALLQVVNLAECPGGSSAIRGGCVGCGGSTAPENLDGFTEAT